MDARGEVALELRRDEEAVYGHASVAPTRVRPCGPCITNGETRRGSSAASRRFPGRVACQRVTAQPLAMPIAAPMVTSLSQWASLCIRAYAVTPASANVLAPTIVPCAGARRIVSLVTAAAKAKAAVLCPEGKDSWSLSQPRPNSTSHASVGFTRGRARPRVNPTDAWDVEFGRGWDNDHESFPSGHSTAAFAFAAAVTSETMRRAPAHGTIVGASTFALAGVTAYARMHSDAHWLSDVTMGAAIGMASGWAVTRWHATRPGNRLDAALLPRRVSPFVMQGPQGRTLVGATLAWP